MKVLINPIGIENKGYDKIFNSIELFNNEISPASVIQVVCENALDNYKNRAEGIQALLSKLRYGGKLSIIGIDGFIISLALINGLIDVNQYSTLLYKHNNSISCLSEMINIIEKYPNFKVSNAFTEDFNYFIMVERNVNS